MVNDAGNMSNIKSKLYSNIRVDIIDNMSEEDYKRLMKSRIKRDKTLDFIRDNSKVKFLLE